MLKSLFHTTKAAAEPSSSHLPSVNLLVIQSDAYDWQEIFAGKTLRNGRGVRVVQCGWDDCMVSADSYSRQGISVDVRTGKGQPFTGHIKIGDKSTITFRPDFCLIRNEVFIPSADHRNLLYGLMFANVPCVNSLHSIYCFCERPIVQAELNRLSKQLGNEAFPVVEQSYFSGHRGLMYGNKFPAVVKVGAAHAGMGKMKIQDHHDMEDFRTVLAMTEGKYCTVEPFLDGEYDLRIQKIGNHYRAFKRISISGTWKTNTGTSHAEQLPITDAQRLWVDKASEIFGGLDICTVDAIHDRASNRDYIMEINGTSSGLFPDCADEDNGHIRDLILEKMNALFCQDS